MNAPRSSAAAPLQSRWSLMRASSRDDDADVLAARRQLDAQQLLDRVVPGDLVGDRRDVVHAVDDRDVLVVVEVLAELLEAASAGSRCRAWP